jgi:PEP-CTERM motif-containing protein
MLSLVRALVIGIVFAMMWTTPARADDFITGFAWITTETIAASSTAATSASLALGTCSHGTAACTPANADVSFTTTGIDLGHPSLASGTIAQFLASSAFPLNNLVDKSPSTALDPTIWEFIGNTQVTGTPGTPQSFTFQHDDGMTFVVNGQMVVNAPGPTGPVLTTGSYTGGASTNAPFTLIYAECCGGSAVIATSLVGPGTAPPTPTVPEPASLLLVAVGMAGGLWWRKR